MSNDRFSVGAEVEARCTKCKMDRLHVIESLKPDGSIHRVLCRTCNGMHLYRRPQSAPPEKAPRRKATAAAKSRSKKQVLSAEDAARAKPYSVSGSFAVGDIISHKTFGTGRVLDVKPGGKMEVGFETGAKLLVCSDAR